MAMNARLLRPKASGFAIAEARDSSDNVLAPIDYTDAENVRWRAHVFNTSGTLNFSRGGRVEYLIVAGGGAGGRLTGGGGGAGGLLTNYDSDPLTVSPQSYEVAVGAGGVSNVSPAPGGSGGNSSAFGLTAIGGGGGSPNSVPGVAGGSGGGGGHASGGVGGAGTAGQGTAGGNGGPSPRFGGGGGGGAGSAGSVGQAIGTGNGGDGVASPLSGVVLHYAGGGGGGIFDSSSPAGQGGLGGGGNGGNLSDIVGKPGLANTGGGGGGNGQNGAAALAHVGGSGVVIVRYRRSADSSLNPDAQDWVNRLSAARSTVSQPVANAVSAFVDGCQSDGIWDAMASVVLLAGADTLAGALVPLKGAAPTNNGPFVTGDYNRETGLIGNGSTKHLNSNRNNNADPQNSKHISLWRATAATTDAGMIGSNGVGAGDSHIFAGFNNFIFRNNAQTSSSTLLSTMTGAGFVGTSRASSSAFTTIVGTSLTTASVASQTPRNATILVFETGGKTNARLGFYSIGESLDLALLDTRVSTLMQQLRPQAANADAQDWINRVYANGGSVSTGTATAVNTFCNDIDAAGIRDRFFRLNLFCGTGLNAALVPLYRSASLGGSPLGNTIDNNNGPFGSGDYVETGASGGLTGTGNNGINAGSSKHLRTGLQQSTLATSNLHLSAFVFGLNSVGPQQSGIVSIRDNAAPANRWWLEYRGSINAELGGGVGFGAIPAQTGNTFLAVSRESNTLLRPYVNGAQQGADITTNITASLANRTREWYICASNIDGSAFGFFPYRMGMYSIGSTMTGAQMASFNSAVTAFNSAMSRT